MYFWPCWIIKQSGKYIKFFVKIIIHHFSTGIFSDISISKVITYFDVGLSLRLNWCVHFGPGQLNKSLNCAIKELRN